MASKKRLYYAKRLMDYAGKTLYPGQVTELGGHLNDEKLVRLGLFMEYTDDPKDLVQCSACGEQFISHNYRIGHYELLHKKLSDEQEDRLIDRLDERFDKEPLVQAG